jgi:hypothetical protein
VGCLEGKGVKELRGKVIELAKQQSILKQTVATSFIKVNEYIKENFKVSKSGCHGNSIV